MKSLVEVFTEKITALCSSNKVRLIHTEKHQQVASMLKDKLSRTCDSCLNFVIDEYLSADWDHMYTDAKNIFDVVIMPTAWVDSLYTHIVQRNLRECPTILLDFPDPHLPPRFYNALCSITERVVGVSTESLSRRNIELSRKLSLKRHLRITSKYGTNLCIEREDAWLSEDCTWAGGNLIQLPGGEVFCALKPHSANGQIVILQRGCTYTIPVVDGLAFFEKRIYDKAFEIPICELGFGTNSEIPALSSLPFLEKCFGTCHFGFGDNTTFGGRISHDKHFDIVLPDFEVWDESSLLITSQELIDLRLLGAD